MDKPWETNVNNGYSSVLFDPDNSLGLGVYRAFYSASDGGFGAPDCPKGECGSGSATLVANSSDGLVWEKPRLGLFGWASKAESKATPLSNASGPLPCCKLCPAGLCPCPFCGRASASETNILFEDTTAVAIFDDTAHDKNSSRRFKVWGNLAAGMISGGRHSPSAATSELASKPSGRCFACFIENGCRPGPSCDECAATAFRSCIASCNTQSSDAWTSFCHGSMPWKAPQVAGIAVSADGYKWTDYKELQSPADSGADKWRFDAQATMFYDERRRKYIGTDRAFRPCQSEDMPFGKKESCGMCPIWWQPHGGCQLHRSAECTSTQCNHTVCVQI
eukprot:SAG31_NODE_7092_length_1791_cov_1.023050_2_plen_335_part_00